MEEPLIIRRDEGMFRFGLKICLPGFLVLVVCSILAIYKHIDIWSDYAFDLKSANSVISFLWYAACLVIFIGARVIVKSYRYRYKLDESGITEKYNSSILRALRSWAECDCLGVKYVDSYQKIVCSRNIGGSVLELCYTPEMWEKVSTYAARHGVKILEPEILNQSTAVRRSRKTNKDKSRKTVCVLRDIQGELVINDKKRYQRERKKVRWVLGPIAVLMVAAWYIIASFIDGSFIKYIWVFPLIVALGWLVLYNEELEAGNQWIVNRKGIQSTSPFRKKVTFYNWSEIERVGAYTEGIESGYFYIFFIAYGKHLKNKVRFTEKRYEEFLKYVPEGKETDPINNEFLIRWRSLARSYGKSRDDYDEW